MALGVLAQLPDIKGTAIAKLRSQALAQLAQLERAVDDSQTAVQQLRCWFYTPSSGAWVTTACERCLMCIPLVRIHR